MHRVSYTRITSGCVIAVAKTHTCFCSAYEQYFKKLRAYARHLRGESADDENSSAATSGAGGGSRWGRIWRATQVRFVRGSTAPVDTQVHYACMDCDQKHNQNGSSFACASAFALGTACQLRCDAALAAQESVLFSERHAVQLAALFARRPGRPASPGDGASRFHHEAILAHSVLKCTRRLRRLADRHSAISASVRFAGGAGVSQLARNVRKGGHDTTLQVLAHHAPRHADSATSAESSGGSESSTFEAQRGGESSARSLMHGSADDAAVQTRRNAATDAGLTGGSESAPVDTALHHRQCDHGKRAVCTMLSTLRRIDAGVLHGPQLPKHNNSAHRGSEAEGAAHGAQAAEVEGNHTADNAAAADGHETRAVAAAAAPDWQPGHGDPSADGVVVGTVEQRSARYWAANGGGSKPAGSAYKRTGACVQPSPDQTARNAVHGTVPGTASAAHAPAVTFGGQRRVSRLGLGPPAMPQGLAALLERENWVRHAAHDPHGVIDVRQGLESYNASTVSNAHKCGELDVAASKKVPLVVTFCGTRGVAKPGALHAVAAAAAAGAAKAAQATAKAEQGFGPPPDTFKSGQPTAAPGRRDKDKRTGGDGGETGWHSRLQPAREPIMPPLKRKPKMQMDVQSRFDSQHGFADGLYDDESNTLFL